MNLHTHSDAPPPDFVAFLAQRSGLSQEDAEHRLESWLDEYQASVSDRADRAPASRSRRADLAL